MKTDGGPAFPGAHNFSTMTHGIMEAAEFSPHQKRTLGGMSLRDYFAAAAIKQMLPWAYDAINDDRNKVANYVENIAKTAYDLADAMLAEREKRV